MYSVIIPVWNQIEFTVQTVKSFLDYAPIDPWELIFIDNGSTDGTEGYLRGLAQDIDNVKIITNPTNLGFPKSINQGIKTAQYNYIALLNNDVILTPQWIERLRDCLDKSGDLMKLEKIGMVGPATNFAGGRQMVQGIEYDITHLPRFAEIFYRKNKGNWFEVGFLSGFCILARKEMFDEVGLFDEDFTPGGYEDNDFILRASAKGWKAVVAGDVFLHHYGSRTMDTAYPHLRRGLAHKEKFYRKYFEVPDHWENKLVAVYRVKDSEETLRKSLAKTATFADEIILLDDGSKDRTREIANSFSKVIYEYQDKPFNERRDRNHIIQKARMRQADWIISIDGDEVFEDKFDRAYVERLMNPVNPEVKCYGFTWMTFWHGKTHYRADGNWGTMEGFRLFKNEPDRTIVGGNKDGLHCFNIPLPPPENRRRTSVRIKHYGYDSLDKARQKYEFYERLDTDRIPELIGREDYSHIIDDSNLRLLPWIEDNGIALCMMVKNEEERIMDILDLTWPFVDEIILVDTGSIDRTLELAELYGANIFKFKMRDDFSEVRNFAKKKASQRWILHLDPDEVFDPKEFFHIRRMMEQKCHGYLFELINHQLNGQKTVSESVRLYRNIPELVYYGRVHETFDKCLPEIQGLRLLRAPFRIHHQGYLKNPADVDRKLKLYERLNKLQMRDDPNDPNPYYNLALHYLNEGDTVEGYRLLVKAIQKKPTFWLAQKELAYYHLWQARDYMDKITDILPPTHPFWKYASEMSEYLKAKAGKKIMVGSKAVKEFV
jgi:glycosyltransferase involved in cell wall biosynthesis